MTHHEKETKLTNPRQEFIIETLIPTTTMDTESTTLLFTMLEQIKNPMRYLVLLLFRNAHVREVLR